MSLLDKKKIKFTEVYSDYYQIVYGAIYTKIASVNDTDELTQEVFTIYYSKMDEVENIRAWLLGTMKYVLLNFFKKKKKLANDDIDDYLNDLSVTYVNGFQDTRIIIEEAIDSLNERDRLLFDLVAVQNLTYDHAGKHLGLTRRQTQYRYSLILKDVRNFLNDRGINNIEDLL